MMVPALLTPPPITKASGLTTHAMMPRPLPRILPNSLAISIATSSPSFTASHTTLQLMSLLRRMLGLLSFSSLLFASLTTPVAEPYCSRQPFLPHPQVSVSFSSMKICPISPPAPFAPATILPSIITPPPTPVPSVTITIEL